MPSIPRRVAFVLAAFNHGPMIMNRLDYATSARGDRMGVGFQLLESGAYDPGEVKVLLQFLSRRRAHFGDGVVALDCGANLGVHTIEWANHMTGWGSVIAIEAQERIFYALAGNIALNNCHNARAIHAALGAQPGAVRVPVPNYLLPGSFGSLELRPSEHNEFIGQTIDYSEAATAEIAMTTIDSLGLTRLDVLKIDVEGMEAEVLEGAGAALAAFHPIIVAEHTKAGWETLEARLSPFGYTLFRADANMIAIHPADPSLAEVQGAA
jgi:FkbM family methyltransferase